MRSFKFGIEEPHRIKNFAESCRCSCPVSLSKGENAIVSQISHDRRVGNCIVDQVAGLERGPGRGGYNLDEFKELHLIDRIWQCFHDRRYLRENICVCVHKGVSHGGPVVEPMIQITNPCLFLVVAKAQCRIKGCYRLFYRCPLLSTILIFGWASLQTSLVSIRARIPYVLIAICLGKEQPQADTACRFSIRRIKALGSRNGNSQIDNVLEWSI